ncbi:30S ribosome-binding factor RbfA [Candidatus Giovannonibacteria bacterium]|nr:30S ribosome-binding factor RbfA [Candidatus Giovannonibacteria bacterium]
MNHRQEKLASLYNETVSVFLQKNLFIKDGTFSVTKVEISDDLNHLKIFFSVWPDSREKDVLNSLEDLKKEMRFHLASQIKTKFVPTLEFILDESEKKRLQIESLLKKAK